MKNMKVSKKLIVGFMIMALFTAAVGVIGILGMSQIDNAGTEMYEFQTKPLPNLAKAIEMLQRQRACMREYIVGAAVGDHELIEDAHGRVRNYNTVMTENMDVYYASIRAPEALRLFEEARSLYDRDFQECLEKIYSLAKEGSDAVTLYDLMREYTPATNQIVENFDRCMEMKMEVGQSASDSASDLARTLLTLIIAVLVIALAVAVVLGVYLSGLISKPLTAFTAYMNKAGTTGDITLTGADSNAIREYGQTKDEIGQCIASTDSFLKHVTAIGEKLEKIADGDLTIEQTLLSERDTMSRSLQKMVDSLNRMFSELKGSANQVSTGSKQIADGAQSLAQGSTEQASAVEQLSASVSQIAGQTNENAGIAREAADLSGQIKENAEKGSQQMEQMMTAVQEINEAGGEIGKVIKVIEDIAFQTNILALNAAVEAARAGQHGKGFAVVAEEVRNLAAKSAEAARDTGGLIENSIAKANLGLQIATETSASLGDIVDGINRSAEIVIQIAQSSDQQASAITQVHTGIDQVAQVVQLNSATAEESAAASEEMSSQSNMLEQLTSRFKLKGDDMYRSSAPTLPEKRDFARAVGDDDFGKY